MSIKLPESATIAFQCYKCDHYFEIDKRDEWKWDGRGCPKCDGAILHTDKILS